MKLTTPYTELTGCRLAIQQAPMGTVSTPALAVAVADAGGVGTITALGMPADYLSKVLDEMTALTDGVLAVNFLTEELDRDALAVASERVKVVDFFWVEPSPELVSEAHAGGALVSWQVGSLQEALAAVDAGADVIVVQGIEAGGHIRGASPLRLLLSEVLERVAVPVLAAGGIADPVGFAAVMAAGASGARIGTRFIASDESGAHGVYKQAVVDAGGGTTEITDSFAECPLCATSPRARVLSSCAQAVRSLGADVVGEMTISGRPFPIQRGSGMPPGSTATGRIEAMAMYAGESVAVVNRIAPASEIIAELVGGSAVS